MVAVLLLLILCCALAEVFPRPPPLLGETVSRPLTCDRAELDGVWRTWGTSESVSGGMTARHPPTGPSVKSLLALPRLAVLVAERTKPVTAGNENRRVDHSKIGPTGRRNRPHEGCVLPGEEAGPLATRACVNRVARAHRPDGESQLPEGIDMSNVTNMRDFKNRRDRQELGLDDHRRETRRFSRMATRVPKRRPQGGDDLPPAA